MNHSIWNKFILLLLTVCYSHATVCVVSFWQEWGPCVGNCHFSLEVRNRNVVRPPFPETTTDGRLAIRPCPPLYQVQTCVPKFCPPGTTTPKPRGFSVPPGAFQLKPTTPRPIIRPVQNSAPRFDPRRRAPPPRRPFIPQTPLKRLVQPKIRNSFSRDPDVDVKFRKQREEKAAIVKTDQVQHRTFRQTTGRNQVKPVKVVQPSTRTDNRRDQQPLTEQRDKTSVSQRRHLPPFRRSTNIPTRRTSTGSTHRTSTGSTHRNSTQLTVPPQSTVDKIDSKLGLTFRLGRGTPSTFGPYERTNQSASVTAAVELPTGRTANPCRSSEIDSRCCPNANLRGLGGCPDGRKAQRVIRWMRSASESECTPYNYNYCGSSMEVLEKPIKFEEECYDLCFESREKRTSKVFSKIRFQNGFKVQGGTDDTSNTQFT